MAWTPTETLLTTLDENIFFSRNITYTDDLTSISYPVTLTSNQTNPNTIFIGGNNINGYYFDTFDYTVQYRTTKGEFITVNKFSNISQSSLNEVISYKASLSISKTFTYTATAYDGETPIATNVYSVIVTNNWTEGKELLQLYVNAGSPTPINPDDESIISWINLLGNKVTFTNLLGNTVYWRNSL